MRQLLSVAIVTGLGGCSLIYNPSNLPAAPDEAGVKIDAEIILDSDPTLLALEQTFPPTLDEGAGVDGSRPALLVITGTQIVPGAMVTVARTGGGTTTAVVDNTMATLADDGDMLSVPITIGIDGALAGTASYKLDVTVTQAGTVTRTLPGAVTVQGYEELTGSMIPAGLHRYSRVMITGFTAAAAAEPVVVRSNSSLAISGAIMASAVGATGGPGGGNGGINGTTTTTAGDGMGPGKGLHNSGGGGFGTAGGAGSAGGGAIAGDAGFRSLAMNRGSGGAGGAGGVGTGGVGGGGGGTVELSALGNLTIAGIAADGATGTAGNNGVSTTDGGSGSGGGVLLRAGGTLVAPAMVSVAGGAATTNGKGALGGNGRVRLDAPMPSASVASTVAAYRGPMFLTTTPLITRTNVPLVSISCESNMPFNYFIIDERGNNIAPSGQPMCGTMGTADLPLAAKLTPLGRGTNHLCLLVDGGTYVDMRDEDRNCIDIVYIFKQ